jgi:hypothetical protein
VRIIIRQTRICNGKTLFQQFIGNRYERQFLAFPFVDDTFVKLAARPVVLTGIESTKEK